MVIDTSAIMAILRGEPEAAAFLLQIENDARPLLSAATLVELHIVCVRRVGPEGLPALKRLLDRFRVEIVPFDEAQSVAAVDAFLRYGKSRHYAKLNFGDCMTYALAKGNDFGHTDLPIA